MTTPTSRNGEENWQRLVRLLRDPECTGRHDLMADAAKMIEQLVRFLDNAEQRADARAREACTFEKRKTCSFATPSESVDITVPRDLWNEILDFITDRVDVKDGASGPIPNKAMHLCSRIAEEVNP